MELKQLSKTLMINHQEVTFYGNNNIPAMGIFTSALLRSLQQVKSKRIIDVGCGSGVIGIYALIQGCDFVLFNDIQKEALELTSCNLKSNQILDRFQLRQCPFSELDGMELATFDLLTFCAPQFPIKYFSQNPFPNDEQVFRDGGPDGWKILREFLDWYATLKPTPPPAILVFSSILGKSTIRDEIQKRDLRWKHHSSYEFPLRQSLVKAFEQSNALLLEERGIVITPDGKWCKSLHVIEVNTNQTL